MQHPLRVPASRSEVYADLKSAASFSLSTALSAPAAVVAVEEEEDEEEENEEEEEEESGMTAAMTQEESPSPSLPRNNFVTGESR